MRYNSFILTTARPGAFTEILVWDCAKELNLILITLTINPVWTREFWLLVPE
jgi:hypothetical protein